jgi:tetratricopeptide (TPR) repeat protein
MAEEQSLSTGLEVLKIIGAGGIGGAIASCIGKLFVDRKLQDQKHKYDKQLESLKTELGKKLQAQQHDHDEQLEFLKSKLEKKDTIHKLQFKKEFELYGELWKALVAVRKTAIITPTLDHKPKGKPTVDVYSERFAIAADAFNKAKNLFEDHRPFYHDDVSKITRVLLRQCRGYISNVSKMLSSEKRTIELCEEADELLKRVPEAIDEIEKVIKLRIGILQKAEIVE